jgi:hypothetical protein
VVSRGIVRNLRRRRPVLTPDEVSEIAEVASRRGTWHRDAVVLDDAQRVVQRFERLRHEVDAAAYRRKAWTLLGQFVLVVATVWVCIQIVEIITTALASSLMP